MWHSVHHPICVLLSLWRTWWKVKDGRWQPDFLDSFGFKHELLCEVDCCLYINRWHFLRVKNWFHIFHLYKYCLCNLSNISSCVRLLSITSLYFDTWILHPVSSLCFHLLIIFFVNYQPLVECNKKLPWLQIHSPLYHIAALCVHSSIQLVINDSFIELGKIIILRPIFLFFFLLCH